jgi:hypothetical protein
MGTCLLGVFQQLTEEGFFRQSLMALVSQEVKVRAETVQHRPTTAS